jgi:hypothetical protein
MDAANRANEISAAVTNVNHTTYIKLPLQPILDGGDFIDSFYLAPGQQYYIVGNVQQSVNVTAGEHSMVEIPLATPPADPFWGVFNIGGQSQLGPYRMFPTATGVKTQAGLILPAMPNASLVRVEYGTVNLGSVVTDDAAQRQFVLDTLDSMLAVGKDYVVEDKVN